MIFNDKEWQEFKKDMSPQYDRMTNLYNHQLKRSLKEIEK